MTIQRRILFSAFSLSTGAALLVHIITRFSLVAAIMVLLLGFSAGSVWVWRQLSESGRSKLRHALFAGVASATLATLAYDVFRYLLIKVAGFTFWPFDIFTLFGKALVGDKSGVWVTLAGILFHAANGIGFGVFYTVAFGRKGVWAGIAWAMFLETLMVTFYPGWLGLKALQEFLQVSIFGHVVYGATLGATSRYLLSRRDEMRQSTTDAREKYEADDQSVVG